MANVEIKVDGLIDIEKALRNMGELAGGEELQKALGSAAKVIQGKAKDGIHVAVAPYETYSGRKVSPGWLKSQLVTKRVNRSQHTAQTIVCFKNSFDAFFWRFLEFGTSKMRARPFLRKAFEAAKEDAVDRFKDRLKARIDKAKKK